MSALPPVLEALAWALLHFVWQGFVVAGALCVLRACGRDAPASIRYAAAVGAMISMAVLATSTFALSWFRLATAVGATTASVVPGVAGSPAERWMPWLLFGWTCGVTGLTLRWLLGWHRLRTMLRDHSAELGSALQHRFRRLVRDVGVSRPVRILASARASVPMLVGCWRPAILVPLSAVTGMPTAYLECAIVHELAHVRRYDPLVHLVQTTIGTLLFYHPGVWWVSRTMDVEREHACDDLVVAITGDRMTYARALAELETLRNQTSAPVLAANGGALLSRIRQILEPSAASSPRRADGWLVMIGAVLLVSVMALAGIANSPGPERDGAAIRWLPGAVGSWLPLLHDAAERHGVDPDLLAILVLVESGGRAEAVSSAGAVGLMQLMPSTAETIAASRGLEGFDVDQLAQPEVNVDFGAWYLARQLDSFGAVELAAAAYNGGPGQLRAHLLHGRPLSRETASYRTLVRELWRDRNQQRSATLDRLRERR